MRIGVFMPLRMDGGTHLPRAERVVETAQAIEEAGLDSIWSLDTLAPHVQPRPDPLTWLLTACLATKRVEVGTAIYVVSNRNPVDVTQRLLTIQALVPGRFTFGVGAGSTETADIAAGTDFELRHRHLHENMDVIRRLCRGEEVGGAFFNPDPTIPPPRFMLGAWASKASLRRAIADYDGWMCSGTRTPAGPGTATMGHLVEAMHRYRELGGIKRAAVSTVSFDFTVDAGHLADDEPFNLRCPAGEAADRLKRLEDLGFDDIYVAGGNLTPEKLDQLRSLAPKDPRPIE